MHLPCSERLAPVTVAVSETIADWRSTPEGRFALTVFPAGSSATSWSRCWRASSSTVRPAAASAGTCGIGPNVAPAVAPQHAAARNGAGRVARQALRRGAQLLREAAKHTRSWILVSGVFAHRGRGGDRREKRGRARVAGAPGPACHLLQGAPGVSSLGSALRRSGRSRQPEDGAASPTSARSSTSPGSTRT